MAEDQKHHINCMKENVLFILYVLLHILFLGTILKLTM